jgi:YidC/Oxa1 family membrane protein insertase
MRMMPLVFGAFLAFSGFPSGLFVYWITSNCITFIQNYVIYYVLPHKKPEDIQEEPPPDTEKDTSPATKNGAANGKVPQNPNPAQPQKKSGRAKNRRKKKVAKRK